MKLPANSLVIALPKGRILKETLPLFAAIGIEPLDDMFESRKLIFPTNQPDLYFIKLRPVDVPTYVEYGAADLGVAGKDVLMEHNAEEVYELLDLNIARCRLMTAHLPNAVLPAASEPMKVASKFTNTAKNYFAAQGRQVQVIKLYGAQELAPIMQLADCIVDIVDTGNTLRANGLVTGEHIADISSRLVASRLALKLKDERIQPMVEAMKNLLTKQKG